MEPLPKFSIAREPAIVLTLAATIVRVLVAHFVHPDADVQAWVDAAVTAAGGLVVAVWVTHEKQVPALLGCVQAMIALAVGFGFHITSAQQAAVMSIVGGLAALFVRTQVVAPGGDPALLGRRI